MLRLKETLLRVINHNLEAENKACIVGYLNLFQGLSNVMSCLIYKDDNDDNDENILNKYKLDSLLDKIKEIRDLVHSQTCYDNTENKLRSERMLLDLNQINERLLFLKLSKIQSNY